jgi:DNA-3-methyladenine glycosylase II
LAEAVTRYFPYSQREIDYLQTRDAELGEAIARIGRVERAVMPDLFTAMVHAVVGQLISAQAADTILTRLKEAVGEITPAHVAAKGAEAIQRCGLTKNKAMCLASIADSVVRGEWSLEQLRSMPDEAAIEALTGWKGIGRWTAEMVLLHGLERPDVVSWGDAAIRRGMMKLYGLSSLTRDEFEMYRQRYAPHGSIASIYLWEISFH